jgi:outer membrane lipoprotein-sorting protein
MGKKNLRTRPLLTLLLMLSPALVFISGCATSEKKAVAPAQAPIEVKTASRAELIDRYNRLADSIHTLNVAITIQLTSGSRYTGIVEQYHEVTGFILASKPSNIRVIGQVPIVGKNIFDMESDGSTFHIFVPSKNQFLVGPANLDRPSEKPIENLRPQHLLDAIFWEPISKDAPVLLEQTSVTTSNFYVLTVARAASPGDWQIDRKVWFDRATLEMARIDIYDSNGVAIALIRYYDWEMFGSVRYPRHILMNRPVNDYQLQLAVTKLTANEPISADRFVLDQPPGTQLVRVGEASAESHP